MKKRLVLLLVLTLVVAGFTTVNTTSAPQPVEAQDAPVLLIWADETRAEIIEGLADEFLAEYGVQLEVQQIGFGDIRDQFIVAGPAGEGPDIFIGAHDWTGELAASGLLAPVDLGDLEENFVPASLGGFTYDGALYGMPYAVENVAFFRNVDLVPEAPATWDEVRSISEELVESGEVEYGYVIQENDPFHAFGIQTAFGGYVFAFEEGVGYDPSDIGIGSEGTVAAFEWLDAMVEDGLTPDGLDYDSMHALFESGDAAMMISGPWAVSRIEESGVNYAISVLPAGPEGPAQPFLGVQGFFISAFASDPLLAQIFLTEFVATDEVMQTIYEANDRPPAWLPVLETIEDENLLAFGEAGQNGLAMPNIPQMSAVWESWGNAMQLVIQQQEEPEAAFTNAADQIEAAIAESE
ncbi:MAG: maltose ABC transporter substrate-binding protein [Chloroflexi bacterium]|nr:maltose ABC transporter substrate-binding protein [Chloroflexota bacterium]